MGVGRGEVVCPDAYSVSWIVLYDTSSEWEDQAAVVFFSSLSLGVGKMWFHSHLKVKLPNLYFLKQYTNQTSAIVWNSHFSDFLQCNSPAK